MTELAVGDRVVVPFTCPRHCRGSGTRTSPTAAAPTARWTGDLLPLVEDPADPLGVMDLATHHAPLADAPGLYETFQKKADGCIKVVLHPEV